MNYILFKQVLIWMEEAPDKISKNAIDIIYSNSTLLVSKASVWEIAIKRSIDKLTISKPTNLFIKDFLESFSASLLSIELEDIFATETLSLFHRDPFDRLLIAQAINRNIPIISTDKLFDQYPIKRIW